MAPGYRRALFLFRRDLRLDDNTGLLRARDRAEQVLAAFVLDPRQGAERNPYFGAHAFQLLLESLEELASELAERGGRLHLFRGLPHEVVERLIREAGVEAVFLNRDYTPFSRRRDDEIAAVADRLGVPLEVSGDLLLHEPEEVMTGSGSPYRVFAPYHRRARSLPVRRPQRLGAARFLAEPLPFGEDPSLLRRLLPERKPDLHVQGGRRGALALLARAATLADDERRRDLPAEAGTTGLSAHHKLGTVSIRESYHALAAALGEDSALVRQLFWRDFFTQIAWFEPRVFGAAFQERFAAVEWDTDPDRLAAWQRGKTGFPIVDAGMRQLAESGWMHNRVRMIVASFLTKDLHLDWREGERHFARHLVDYDPAVNNGNWQWAASTGADAQPYFRIFNPWTQQRRFDPEARYIRRWVPELGALEPHQIHDLAGRRPPGLAGYPPPRVDHHREQAEARRRFERIR